MSEGLRRGELRAIDYELAPISLMGMVVIFQFLRPIISVVLGTTNYDAKFVTRIATHTIDLFLNGAAQREERSQPVAPAPKNKTQTRKKRAKVRS
jgi:hypothetical protein